MTWEDKLNKIKKYKNILRDLFYLNLNNKILRGEYIKQVNI